MDESISEAFARRDAFRRKKEHSLSFEERARKLFARMSESFPGKGMSAEGYRHFLRRNFKARAINPIDESPPN
jgi:hypothetical protein